MHTDPTFDVAMVLAVTWAIAGVIATTKAARANPELGTDSITSGSVPTFGQWRRAAYRHHRDRIRRMLPTRPGAATAGSLAADAAARSLAGGIAFAAGLGASVGWFTGKRTIKAAARGIGAGSRAVRRRNAGVETGDRLTRQRNSRPVTHSGGDRSQPDPTPASTTAARPAVRGASEGDLVFEFLDDFTPTTVQPAAGTSRQDIADAEEVPTRGAIARPGLPIPSISQGVMMFVHTIHDLFAMVRTKIAGIDEAVDNARIAAAASATRAVDCGTAASTAAGEAGHLSQVYAFWADNQMDPASLDAILGTVEAAQAYAAALQRAAQLEDELSAANAAVVSRGVGYSNALQQAAETVHARQGAHAQAQLETGNAAASADVLAGA